jgi:hypothetical protein
MLSKASRVPVMTSQLPVLYMLLALGRQWQSIVEPHRLQKYWVMRSENLKLVSLSRREDDGW